MPYPNPTRLRDLGRVDQKLVREVLAAKHLLKVCSGSLCLDSWASTPTIGGVTTGNLLPKVAYMTRLDYFILGSTILVFITLIEVLITSALAKAKRKSVAKKWDLWCRWLFPAAFLVLVGVLSF